MAPKSLALGLAAAAGITAAAGGAYVAVRHNAADAPASVESSGTAGVLPREPVAETEAVVSSTPPAQPVAAEASKVEPPKLEPVERFEAEPSRTTERVRRSAPGRKPATVARTAPATPTTSAGAPAGPVSTDPAARPTEPAASVPAPAERSAASREPAATPPTSPPAAAPMPEPVRDLPSQPRFVEVVVPAYSVVGLRVETAITSETARVEDRVEGRVTRDVIADDRVAIAAGTRVLGDVTLVERGGKMKEKARLGVRFHTLVLADGRQVPLRTDPIFREGSSPGAESARKIGGAAIGGAILGAIIGGGKGAAIGGATGAAGGSAVVMAGDRNPASLAAGTVVTVRLNSPVSLDVEKQDF
jgi:hypothetical protein